MSLQYLVNVTKCAKCPNMVPIGRVKLDRPRLCEKCLNKKKYERRKILLKLGRLRKKKCHVCGGAIPTLFGVYCSSYCRWIASMKHRHYKIILRMEDLA